MNKSNKCNCDLKKKYRKKFILGCGGWIGMALILVSYGLLSFGFFRQDELPYHTLNLIGAFGVMFDCLEKKVFPPAILNVFIIVIAFAAIIKILLS